MIRFWEVYELYWPFCSINVSTILVITCTLASTDSIIELCHNLLYYSKCPDHVVYRHTVEVEGTLRLMVSQYVLVSSTLVGLVTRYYFLSECWSEICGLMCVGRPLWWGDGSAICSVIIQWSKSRRTRNHALLSHLRPPSWRARFPYFIPQERWPSYTTGHWVPIMSSLTTHLWQLTGLRWRYLTFPQPGGPDPRTYVSHRNRMVKPKVTLLPTVRFLYLYPPGTGWPHYTHCAISPPLHSIRQTLYKITVYSAFDFVSSQPTVLVL
jgi:hypothetical protein